MEANMFKIKYPAGTLLEYMQHWNLTANHCIINYYSDRYKVIRGQYISKAKSLQ